MQSVMHIKSKEPANLNLQVLSQCYWNMKVELRHCSEPSQSIALTSKPAVVSK